VGVLHVSQELLKKCINNDRKAHYELYKLCYTFIMRVCYRYYTSKDDALSVHNESFLKIVLNLEKYKGEAPFEAWMRRIVVNTIIDNYRKTKKLKELVQYIDTNAPDFVEPPPPEGPEAELKMEADDIYRLIHLLPPMCRKVFNMYVVDGYSHREIAETLQISEGTSKSQLFDARKKMQQMIKDLHIPKAARNEPAE
jgi:RNA polymerase sigma-70 factor (ECF subfamily)